MFTAILKNNRSLSFYQSTSFSENHILSSDYGGGLSAVAASSNVFSTATTTTGFNSQLNYFQNILNSQRDELSAKIAEKLSNDPTFQSYRQKGVDLAWKYEKADILMGGKGSENWNQQEQQEILDNVNMDKANNKGGVRGAEGHHQKNVNAHPEEQGNPDNIKIYRNRREHLEKGHNGDFHNETDGPMTDKNKMLEKTNLKRVFKNELIGVGIAAAIGVGVGFTIGFVVSLAQSGVSPESLKMALGSGAKSGAESGILSVAGYGIGRTIGQVAASAMEGILGNLGVEITSNISKMCNMGVVGALTITVFSVYQFVKLRIHGVATREAIMQVGKQALFSLSLLAVSIAAQGIWGGAAGMIVSISVGIIVVLYSVGTAVHQRQLSEKIRVYTIDKCKPAFV